MDDNQPINISLDLHNYNNQLIETDAILKYSGKNFLGENHRYVWPYKFKINCNNYPLYVPNIINEFIPHKTDNSTESILNNSEGYYITDWAITVKLKTGRSKTAPIRWIKSGFKQPLTSNLFINKYFWISNSDEIATMINDCLNSLVNPNMIIMIKEGDRWSVLINADHYDELEGIYFNDNMKRYFSFDYSDDGLNKITTSKFKTININDVNYYAITTPNTNNKMFPFDRVVFKSEKLPVFQLLVQTYDDTIFNSTSSVIMSYDLAVNDISEITTSMSYINTSRDRSLSLSNNRLPDYFTIECYLVTPSGYEHKLRLRPTEKISLSLMFH